MESNELENRIDGIEKLLNEILEVLDLIQDAHIKEIKDIQQLINIKNNKKG